MSIICESTAHPQPNKPSAKGKRRRPRPFTHFTGHAADAPTCDGQATAAVRHLITRGVFAIPILSDASPDHAHAGEGITVDIGRDGIRFEIAIGACPATTKWLVGLEDSDGKLAYFTVKARESTQRGLGLHVDAEFVDAVHDPLRPANLRPRFDPHSYKFRTEIPTATLSQWHALGVAQPELLDCVVVCPRCHSLPTFRRGCRACGSLEVETVRLIHHFSCAHVDLIESFEAEDRITCPKCRTRALVVGADYEFLRGPYSCRDCGWSDQDLENIGRCMACGFEFPENQGVEQEVIGYHVERLEPLALLPTH